ncbi:Hypothetical predicted protein [Cloeon dipterum]|uniref:Tyrosine-protein kinase receptor n=1 Tax=Cloeon dipterum TaxID=197152 RepID=A0A8S1DEH5_9INSE|nr:Hypothetical predicted protein [Cloeon dipterum]
MSCQRAQNRKQLFVRVGCLATRSLAREIIYIIWTNLFKHISSVCLQNNKKRNECPGCPEKGCPVSPQKNEPLCWNKQHCQKAYSTCPESSNCSSKLCNDNGTCCHENCIGGCFGNGADQCFACKNVNFNGKCISRCPVGTYEYINQRCIEEAECRNISVPESIHGISAKSMIPFNNSCTPECPPNHQESEIVVNNMTVLTCKPCYGSQCRVECEGLNVDSIQSAQHLRGCTHIKGGLEITIRGGSTSFIQFHLFSAFINAHSPPVENIVRELEENLNSIQEIDYLKIVRSYPLVSLNFLKNLTVIRGTKLYQDKYAIVMRDNPNMQELWEWGKDHNLTVNGRLFFHNNPKLCINKIMELKERAKMPEFTDTEVAPDSNGDKVACNVTTLRAYVVKLNAEGVILGWQSYKHHDPRELLGYVVYYIEAPSKNISLFDGRDACGNDGWHVEDVQIDHDEGIEQSGVLPDVNHLIAHLKPYTQYAYYVKTYMLSSRGSNAQGGQSILHYFRTQPSVPSSPRHLKAFSNSTSEIVATWSPPAEPNGNITSYKVRVEYHMTDFIEQRDYCKEKIYFLPEKKENQPQIHLLDKEEKISTALSDKGTCSCDEQKKVRPDEGDKLEEIGFEDYLQNIIYVKRPSPNSRRRRDTSEAFSYGSGKRSALPVYETKEDSTNNLLLFPDTVEKSGTATPPPQVEEKNKRDEKGRYLEFTTNVTEPMVVIKMLKHFSSYKISVAACRELMPNETRAHHCSLASVEFARTSPQENADNLDSNRIFIEINNTTVEPLVRVRWDEPVDPNGLVVTYTLEYRRVDVDPPGKSFQECISRQEFRQAGGSYVIGEAPRNLQPGNYSLRISASTMVGQGEYSSFKYFVIEKSPSNPSQLLIVVFIVVVFLMVVVIGLMLQNHRKKTHLANMKIIATVNPEYVSTIYVPDEWEVPRKKIELIKELGQGSFGMVYEGIARDIQNRPETPCAVKTAGAQATERERMEFLKEASVMKEFKTNHVVRLLGVVSQGCPELPALVIMELMANGDLKTYLRSHRPDEESTDPNARPPTLKRILQMAVEIADGMAYLAFKKFVHRDLAARNCMVAADMTVKIGDFGMTRDIYDTDYYRKDTKGLLPVRWMAPESLRDGIFTSSSDVWSYGVVLWEMATLALQPYQGLSNDQVLRYVIDGGVMEPPENCPQRLYDLMKLCWQTKPQRRPSFLELVTRLIPDVDSTSFAEVSFYHQPDNRELRDQAVALVISKSRLQKQHQLQQQHHHLPSRVDIEDFHIGGPDSESEEDVGEAAALTAPLRSYPALSPIDQRPQVAATAAANNNQGDAKLGNGGGQTANGFLGHHHLNLNLNHNNHHHRHNNHTVASSSSEPPPHKTTEC